MHGGVYGPRLTGATAHRLDGRVSQNTPTHSGGGSSSVVGVDGGFADRVVAWLQYLWGIMLGWWLESYWHIRMWLPPPLGPRMRLHPMPDVDASEVQ